MTLPSTDHLFPMDIKDLMHHLESIVKNWFQLGMELGLPVSKLEEIEYNNPSNVLRCKRLILQEWQRRPTLKPSWCTLVDALCSIKENTAADKISQQFSELYFSSTHLSLGPRPNTNLCAAKTRLSPARWTFPHCCLHCYSPTTTCFSASSLTINVLRDKVLIDLQNV